MMGHSWVKWVRQLWQNELQFSGDMLERHWCSAEYPFQSRVLVPLKSGSWPTSERKGPLPTYDTQYDQKNMGCRLCQN